MKAKQVMRTQVVVPHNPITPEQYAKKLGISRKRFLELKAITDRVLAENAYKYKEAAPHPEESHESKRDASTSAAKRKPKD